MTQLPDNPKRTLNHFKRLTREGHALLDNQPLGELVYGRWINRAEKYIKRKMPDIQVPSYLETVTFKMPNFSSPTYQPPHPLIADMKRRKRRKQMILKLLELIAVAIERLEHTLESEE